MASQQPQLSKLGTALTGTAPQAGAVPMPAEGSGPAAPKKKKKNKRGKRGKANPNRRQSFAVPDDEDAAATIGTNHDAAGTPRDRPFYKLGHAVGGNLSDTSLESEGLLDHRDHLPMRTRRDSRLAFPGPDLSQSIRQHGSPPFARKPRTRTFGPSDDADRPTDRTPLLGERVEQQQQQQQQQHSPRLGYGLWRSVTEARDRQRSRSKGSSRSPNRPDLVRFDSNYDVNNPPSVPSTPRMGSEAGLDDVMITDPFGPSGIAERRRSAPNIGEALIDIDGELRDSPMQHSTPPSPNGGEALHRRHTLANPAEGDVCFPVEGMSQIAEEDYLDHQIAARHRRRRQKEWPTISVLEEWSREENEERSEGVRAKRISEPVLVDGRLRPAKQRWHRAEEDVPFRFTYFNEEFPSTIHAQTISELVQPGQTFRELFIPDPPELTESSSDEEEGSTQMTLDNRSILSPAGGSVSGTRHSSVIAVERNGQPGRATPAPIPTKDQPAPPKPDTLKPKRFGNRPTFWLDVLSPTDLEMRVISKAFGIHPLTAEDIMMQEAREKVELFRSYYFISIRSFDLDTNSEDYLEPVNIYVVVFRDGVLSFHFSQTPHPANVRRRIRQLKDYLILSADWIGYAILDDVTDVFAPLIQSIEDEVDEIDDAILQLHNEEESAPSKKANTKSISINEKDMEKRSEAGETMVDSKGNLLRRIGQARRRVTLATRLLGNKADVIKGFAKRCNEQWDVAPRSEIGLYLGDIQDHIVTMSSSLSHYENLLSRAHSNYLAQLNWRTASRQETTNEVLGKLSVLGTIFLPLNVVTGMFGANFKVPGQEIDNLNWFIATTGALVLFSITCYLVARRVYGIL